MVTAGRPLCKGPWSQLVAPLQGALAIVDRPLAGGRAMASRPYRRPGRGWLPILLSLSPVTSTFFICCVETMDIWLPRLPRNEQFYPWASLVVIEDSIVSDLYVELVATFHLKRHTCSNLAVKKVIGVAHIYKNGDGLLFKESSNFHCLRVGVTGQCMHCIVGWLGLFLRGFIFEFEVFLRWYSVLILYWFNDEEPPHFVAMFSTPRFTIMPT
ncbi:hypothetical protein B296_00052948 [Ensete ventricosum]|uniref:Uncharacterized protein n=1 Tax=Ensete ventricosum TaxID=4639 RepID=A0A426XQA8_ENSVE|nr:hypothetical protein B296_00052948 [Ensete ventricosum]